ncbi:PREDICTED: F-box/kelch-repeat protein At5g48990-like [Camelina sativa]|uniref:F-box/kelch-repeat protein At5g48990-like n=1 Tax=Camelina sativa TaxID=90675 RepID=A0ABM0X8A0_CAMSA|nr:PREDICTED: F-box/kelch-repeat protein At5g48990-like [Camelina sativa]
MFWRKKKSSKSPTPKSKEPSPKSNPNPSLPHDLIVSILARVSRSYYPNLSLVSKSFRSILASPELYKTRTLLGCTETFLYVCLRFPHEPNPRWFTLYPKKPNQTLINKKKKKEDPSLHLLAPTRILNSPPLEWSSPIAVGSYLYAINADIHDSPSVWYLDCRFHIWRDSPRMRIAHTRTAYDGNVYLPGMYEKQDSLDCVEVYNTETQAWNPVPPNKRRFEFKKMDGIIYIHLKVDPPWHTMAFKPKDSTWESVGLHMLVDRVSFCTVDEVDYTYVPCTCCAIRWRARKTEGEGGSRRLEGLEGLPQFAKSASVKLANHGDKLVVLWDKSVQRFGFKKKMIWCAEISLEKRNDEEIWGKVEWSDEVLLVPSSYEFVCAKSVTV